MDDLYGPLDEIIEEFINDDGTIDEENLRQWFKGGGWRQAGGKYDGKPGQGNPDRKQHLNVYLERNTVACLKRKRICRPKKKERSGSN